MTSIHVTANSTPRTPAWPRRSCATSMARAVCPMRPLRTCCACCGGGPWPHSPRWSRSLRVGGSCEGGLKQCERHLVGCVWWTGYGWAVEVICVRSGRKGLLRAAGDDVRGGLCLLVPSPDDDIGAGSCEQGLIRTSNLCHQHRVEAQEYVPPPSHELPTSLL